MNSQQRRIVFRNTMLCLLVVGMVLWCGDRSDAQVCTISRLTCEPPCTEQEGIFSCPVNKTITFKAGISGTCGVSMTDWQVNEAVYTYSGLHQRFEHTFSDIGAYTVTVRMSYSGPGSPAEASIVGDVSDTYTITVIPSAGGTVKGPTGDDDAIECSGTTTPGSTLCQETYQNDQGIALKAIPKNGWFFIGWKVDGEWVRDEDLIQVLNGN